jgi:hypothetical protein
MEAMTRVAVEVLDSHDRVHTRERLVLGGEKTRFTVGRGTAADVMIDDAYAASLHAAVELGADGQWRITDLGSVNGVIVGGKRRRGATDLALPDGTFQIGRTRLRVRGEHEALAPEHLDRGHAGALSGHLPAIAGAGALVCAWFTSYFVWLAAPRDGATLIAAGLVSLFVGAGVWTAVWALLTRVMRGEARWVTHAAIALGAGAVLLVVQWVMAVSWFAFNLPQIPARDVLLTMTLAAVALYWHISTAAPIARRTALLFAIVVPLLLVGTTSWVEARNHTRDVNFIGDRAQLFPPSLRLRQGETVDAFFDRAATLKSDADRKRKAVGGDDNDEAPDAEDDD